MKNYIFYPEMLGNTDSIFRPLAQIEYACAAQGKYYLKTELELSGRGIIKSTIKSTDDRNNKKTYFVTERALSKLKNFYTTCYIADL